MLRLSWPLSGADGRASPGAPPERYARHCLEVGAVSMVKAGGKLSAGWMAPLLALLLMAPVRAEIWTSADGSLQVGGDLRLRLEQDWNSVDAQGISRDDRTRLRTRLRLGMFYDASRRLHFGVRLRSGADANQQSAHITLLESDGNTGIDADFNLDQWYLRTDGERWSVTAGRMVFPFFHQNEMMWDDDVTPAGLAGSWDAVAGNRQKLRLNAALLAPPDGMTRFHGSVAAGQLVYRLEQPSGGGLTAAAGFFAIGGDEGAENLRNGNGERDYRLVQVALQWRLRAGRRPLVLGADLLHNIRSYDSDDADPFTAAYFDQTDGYVLTCRYGEAREKGDWLMAWFYARVEGLAVNASFAQDDWVRWGSSTQTDSSDLKGHEFRYAHQLTRSMQVMVRLYVVEAMTSVQDGNRMRVDLNYKF